MEMASCLGRRQASTLRGCTEGGKLDLNRTLTALISLVGRKSREGECSMARGEERES